MTMKTVLILAAGSTPQSVTKTLWAILQRDGISAMPAEVHIVTTPSGADRMRDDLLGETGALFRFAAEMGTPALGADLHACRDRGGAASAATGGADEVVALADTAATLIRDLTHQREVRVHAVLADGPPGLGVYMAHALSLFGRPYDRMSCLFVPAVLADDREAWYPRATPAASRQTGGVVLDRTEAAIVLMDMPFLPAGARPSDLPLEGQASRGVDVAGFAQDGRRRLDRPLLEIVPEALELRLGSLTCRLQPRGFALYQALAEARLGLCDGVAADGWVDRTAWRTVDQPVPTRLLEIHETLPGQKPAEVKDFRATLMALESQGLLWSIMSILTATIDQHLADAAETSSMWRSAGLDRAHHAAGGGTSRVRLATEVDRLLIQPVL